MPIDENSIIIELRVLLGLLATRTFTSHPHLAQAILRPDDQATAPLARPSIRIQVQAPSVVKSERTRSSHIQHLITPLDPLNDKPLQLPLNLYPRLTHALVPPRLLQLLQQTPTLSADTSAVSTSRRIRLADYTTGEWVLLLIVFVFVVEWLGRMERVEYQWVDDDCNSSGSSSTSTEGGRSGSGARMSPGPSASPGLTVTITIGNNVLDSSSSGRTRVDSGAYSNYTRPQHQKASGYAALGHVHQFSETNDVVDDTGSESEAVFRLPIPSPLRHPPITPIQALQIDTQDADVCDGFNMTLVISRKAAAPLSFVWRSLGHLVVISIRDLLDFSWPNSCTTSEWR
ncbi:hypothetical protein BKA70DRAFT_1227661 [Coprinopsis sp. MPI-PUGE-AT-0042]|nr:hypothetical protein BKA70DRAFT_1227661 [Coprinopsis sp. MPI-PUGE-AT-0042]